MKKRRRTPTTNGNTNANAQYHLLKLLTSLGVIDNFVLRDNTFVPLKTTWRNK